MSKKSSYNFHIADPDWNIQFPQFVKILNQNNIEIYAIYDDSCELNYVELVFENGRLLEDKKLSSRITAHQLLEGSLHQNQKEIAEYFDFYGSSYQILADMDFSFVSLNVMDRFFEKTLNYLLEQIYTAQFNSESLVKGKLSLSSQLQHQLTEPDFVSYRQLSELVFGSNSVYGYNTSEELIKEIESNDLKNYFNKNFTSDKLKVFYCGKTKTESFWNQILSIIPCGNTQKRNYQKENTPILSQSFNLPNCSQVSLKMGKRIIEKTHKDYNDLYFVNTLLGDYFGSRLMNKVREEHGLCYDINSTLDSQLHDGLFYISAELNAENKDLAIQLIQSEINKLATEKIPDQELNMVKNYLNGHLLRLIDGPYQSILLLKILITELKSIEAFDNLVHTIKNIQSSRINELVSKYLQTDEMSIVLAGNTIG